MESEFSNDDELFEYCKNKMPPEHIQKHIYEYDEYLDLNNCIFPKFILNILNNNILSNNAKAEFITVFLYDYSNNYQLRKRLHNNYILFLNDTYYGIVNSICDVDDIGTKSDRKYIFKIGYDI